MSRLDTATALERVSQAIKAHLADNLVPPTHARVSRDLDMALVDGVEETTVDGREMMGMEFEVVMNYRGEVEVW